MAGHRSPGALDRLAKYGIPVSRRRFLPLQRGRPSHGDQRGRAAPGGVSRHLPNVPRCEHFSSGRRPGEQPRVVARPPPSRASPGSMAHSAIMFPFCGLVILAYHIQTGLTVPATYDQRQTGDLNVQVHVKDLQVVALVDSELLEDYTDYDYFYDYADFTIKPIAKPTTGSTTSVEPWNTWPTNPPSSSSTTESTVAQDAASSSQNNTTSQQIADSQASELNLAAENSTVPSSLDGGTTEKFITQNTTESIQESSNGTTKTRINDKVGTLFGEKDIVAVTDTSSLEESSTLAKPVQGQLRKRCKSGYSPDGKGRCRRLNRRRVSLIPLAMKLAPQFVEELRHKTKNAS